MYEVQGHGDYAISRDQVGHGVEALLVSLDFRGAETNTVGRNELPGQKDIISGPSDSSFSRTSRTFP